MSSASLQDIVNRGLAHHRKNEFAAAEACYNKVLAANPDQPDILHLMGVLLGAQKRLGEAVRYLARAVEFRPREPAFRNTLATALREAGEPAAAASHLAEALRLKPDYAEALCNLGECYLALGQSENARQRFVRALKLAPRIPQALIGLATLERNMGNVQQALVYLRQLLQLAPGDAYLLSRVLFAAPVAADLPELLQAEALARNTQLPNRRTLLYGLAKAYDDLGRYDEAMASLLEAKRLSPKRFDFAKERRNHQALREIFSAEFLKSRENWGEESELPVFIVGMPRSGTSLVEQIIASHPLAYGAGELDDLGVLAARFGMVGVKADATVDAGQVRALSQSAIGDAARTYLAKLRARAPNALRITDKMPHNFERLGLISLMFPKSRIIHCRREPVDTCLSIFMQDFAEAHAYADDLASLGQYYRGYEELMAHWQSTLPLRMIDVSYEELVSASELEAKRIIAFLGLDWDAACLDFHKTARSVSTSSHWQVRQPIYRTSLARWRHYEKHLGPLLQALGESTQNDRRRSP